ncbi:MAG: hypothetical protein AAB383_03020 [Patescibacteria group bacterium]
MAPEKPRTVSDAMTSAEGRVNKAEMDLSVSRKIEIVESERAIRGAIGSYKQMGIYEGVKENFLDVQRNNEDTPEALLENLAFQFDLLTAGEGESARGQIDAVAYLASTQLLEMRTELSSAAGKEMRLEQKVQETYQATLPESTFNPDRLSDTLVAIGETLGQKPNVEKLVGYEQENKTLLTELEDIKNSRAYGAARTEFYNLTGMQIADVGATIVAALKRVQAQASVDPGRAKSLFLSTFKDALDVHSLLNQVMGNVLFNPAHKEMIAHPEASAEVMMTDEEMSLMLNFLIHGAQDKPMVKDLLSVEGFKQIYSLEGAAQVYMGTPVNQLSPNQQYLLATCGGVDSAVGATLDFFRHPIDAIGHVIHVMPYLLKPDTYKMGKQLVEHGANTMTPLEMQLLVIRMTSEMVAGLGIGGGVGALLKVKSLSAVGGKMAGLARVTGAVRGLETFAMAINPVLQQFPRLAAYGVEAAEITEGLLAKAQAVNGKYHLVHRAEHTAHTAHKALDQAEYGVRNTEGATVKAEAAVAKSEPIFRDIAGTTMDISTALGNAKTLGLNAEQIARLQSSLYSLNQLAQPTA